MLNKMSEAQRSMLQAAAAREDRLLRPPGNARGAVTKSLAAKLIGLGLAKETKASNGAPVWRRDAATGAAYALKLTAKGLKEVAAAIEGFRESENSSFPTAAETAPPNAPARKSALSVPAPVVTAEGKSGDVASTTTARAARRHETQEDRGCDDGLAERETLVPADVGAVKDDALCSRR